MTVSDPAAALRCPHCGERLERVPADRDRGRPELLRCSSGHGFDFARHGYVSLLARTPRHEADTAAMVNARERVVTSEAFEPLREAAASSLADALAPASRHRPAGSRLIIDAGAGTGAYLRSALARLPDAQGLALELSKYALRRAARADDRILAVRCDIWGRLPVASGAAEAIMSMFAPRNPGEFHRALAPGGTLHVLIPRPGHLREIREPLRMVAIEDGKRERLLESLGSRFELAHSEVSSTERSITPELAALIGLMGPSARHCDPHEIEGRAATLDDELTVTLDVELLVFQRP